ncbi:MAG: YlbF family regulator [Lachnospiraceae bacterium]|nr:YlbF family regulator [Lachnospiraceae bacterium]MDD3795376.1 YlbF family regulator [Lachnospiraceae bacterium]
MNSVEECTRLLLEAIRNSEEYRIFEEYKKKVKEQPQLHQKINDFRRRVYQQQSLEDTGNLLDEMKNLFNEREEFRKDLLASGYLASELRMCRMLQKISMEVMNVTDIDIEMFEDAISV